MPEMTAQLKDPQSSSQQDDASIQINRVNAELEAAIAAGSVDRLVAIYTLDGQLMPPNHAVVNGQTDIAQYWQNLLSTGITHAKLTTIDLAFHGDIAIEEGAYTMHKEDFIADIGKYVVIWQRQGQHWKYHRDIWNSDWPVDA